MEDITTKPEERRPQKKLAEKVTLLVHGDQGLKNAKMCTDLLFGGNSGILADLSKEDVIALFKGSSLTSQVQDPGMTVLDMAMKANCFRAEKKGIQVIEAGGFSINQAKVTNPQLALLPGIHILPSKLTLIRVGKKNFHIIQWQ